MASTLLPAAEEGFTSLFDGKTRNRWTVNCLPKDREQAKLDWTVGQDDRAVKWVWSRFGD